MAYDSNKHSNFSDRMTNWMRQLWQMKQEAESLTAIYQQESNYGADAAFTDTENATKQEHIDAIVFQESFKAVIDGSAAISQTDRTSNVTPFLMS
jgi:hypothetical protein